jgi:predicted O-methyltransferase YrrM
MKETPLCRLAAKWDCDKTPLIRHGYTPYYDSLLRGRQVGRVLEIGVAGGASMRMWKEYFCLPPAEIFGIDNDPSHIFQADHIHTVLCDAGDSSGLAAVATEFGGGFDLILDDGSHYPDQQVAAFRALLPFLAPGGIYIIEDVSQIEQVSNQISFPHEIHRFNKCSNPSDDSLIVFFNEEKE